MKACAVESLQACYMMEEFIFKGRKCNFLGYPAGFVGQEPSCSSETRQNALCLSLWIVMI